MENPAKEVVVLCQKKCSPLNTWINMVGWLSVVSDVLARLGLAFDTSVFQNLQAGPEPSMMASFGSALA
jgi:hypothetical protein